MCGIAGYSESPDVERSVESFLRVVNTMSHRGPDDVGVYFSEEYGIGLGHTRLAILDLTLNGHQPMMADEGRVVLVFNGEIYNFRDIRTDLQSKGFSFSSDSDTEVLLKLFCSYRQDKANIPDMLRKLNGIFAFAIWDACDGTLLVARDALGVKPLYYSHANARFSFASEIKTLLLTAPVGCEIDHSAIDRYLSYVWCPGSGTPFKNVRKLNPGEAIVISEGKIKEQFVWYQLPLKRRDDKQRIISRDAASDVAKDLESHIRNAVHRQMVSDVPVGAFLSGGLDSSTIVHFARETNSNIRCFTMQSSSNEDGFVDDLPYAKKVAEHLNVSLDIVPVDSGLMASDLESMVVQLDEPLADPAPLNVFYISRLARENGIKVLLSGAGGDDLFSGYRRHHALLLERYWSWFPRIFRRGFELAALTLNQKPVIFRRLRKMFNGASLDADERLVNYFRWIDRSDLNRLYSKDFKRELEKSERVDPIVEYVHDLPSDLSQLERMLLIEQRFFLPDHNLLYTDKMSMAVGLEVRVPFLDLDLVNFAGSIPCSMKQKGREGKWILKKMMEPYLPKEIIYRPKTGFGGPVRRWMRFELRDVVSDVLSSDSLSNRGLFDPNAVQNLIDSNDKGTIDAGYTLLSLVCIELWCRNFIDSDGNLPLKTLHETGFKTA
ncbi:MAG: asparagine synthase (glutamine-hydrolyzing) [Pirellula sp.]|jgi:asparagine synthase (glutamine-hydrolysing)